MSNMLDVRSLEVSPVNNPEQSIEQGNEQGNGPGILGLLFDEMSHGVLIVNPQGRVTHSNRAARDAITTCGVLNTQPGELTALSPMDAKLLFAALTRASAGVRSMVKLSGSGLTLTLSAIPLQFTQGQPCQHIALFFERTAVCDSGMFVFLPAAMA